MYPVLMKWFCFVVGRSFSPSLTRVNESGFEYRFDVLISLGIIAANFDLSQPVTFTVYAASQSFLPKPRIQNPKSKAYDL